MKSWHHPLAATGSSTTLHEAGATNWTQPEHCCPLFGWSWYLAASWVSFACANKFCAIAFVEMMAPAIIGTLFNNERRQTPFLLELDGFVMRALLIPRDQAHLAEEKTFCFPESSGPHFWYTIASVLIVDRSQSHPFYERRYVRDMTELNRGKSVRLISRGNVQASQSLTSPLSLLASAIRQVRGLI
jgi:hypothetical protein